MRRPAVPLLLALALVAAGFAIGGGDTREPPPDPPGTLRSGEPGESGVWTK